MPVPRPRVIRKLHALARRGVLEGIEGGLYSLPARVVKSGSGPCSRRCQKTSSARSGSGGALVATVAAFGFLPFFFGSLVFYVLRDKLVFALQQRVPHKIMEDERVVVLVMCAAGRPHQSFALQNPNGRAEHVGVEGWGAFA